MRSQRYDDIPPLERPLIPAEWSDDEVLGYFARLDRAPLAGTCSVCLEPSRGLNRWHLCPTCADPEEWPEP